MSNSDGTYSTDYLDEHVGFHHSASAGDLDGDGDVDLFVTGFVSDFAERWMVILSMGRYFSCSIKKYWETKYI